MATRYRAEGIGLVRTEALLYGGLTHKKVKKNKTCIIGVYLMIVLDR